MSALTRDSHAAQAWARPERATRARTIARRPPPIESGAPGAGAILVGRDMAPAPHARRRAARLPFLAATLIGAVLAGLLLSAVRTEIFRLRYQLGDAQHQEQQLGERKRALTVEVRTLRDPMRLRRLASERGFTRPLEVIELRAAASPRALRAGP
jgi:hypothetical protein